jgi:hypothetical protein
MQAVDNLTAASDVPKMQAVVRREYGDPDVLTASEIGRPAPGGTTSSSRLSRRA